MKMKVRLLIILGLIISPQIINAEEQADEVRLLVAQNKLLQATLEARDKTIKQLQEEIKELKAEPLQIELETVRESLKAAKQKIAELEKQLEKITPKDNSNVKRLTLKDVAALPTKEAKELQGVRVMGPTVICRIEPDKAGGDKYQVMVIDTSGGQRVPINFPGLATAHWVGKAGTARWVQVRCILEATEATALRLRINDELNVAGNVEKVEIEPATKNTFEVIKLYLKEVKTD